MSRGERAKPNLENVLDDVAARQRSLGVLVDEQEVADEADQAVAEIREEDRRRRTAQE